MSSKTIVKNNAESAIMLFTGKASIGERSEHIKPKIEIAMRKNQSSNKNFFIRKIPKNITKIGFNSARRLIIPKL